MLLVVYLLPVLFIVSGCQKENKSAVPEKPVIYNEDADVRKDIQAALVKAEEEGKNVLLMFGGNGCSWCHLLHNLFESNESVKKVLHDKFILVMVNVSGDKEKRDMALNEKYGDPYRHGFPVLVVLDSDGKQLTTQETGCLEKVVKEGEERGHDPDKVIAFLNQW